MIRIARVEVTIDPEFYGEDPPLPIKELLSEADADMKSVLSHGLRSQHIGSITDASFIEWEDVCPLCDAGPLMEQTHNHRRIYICSECRHRWYISPDVLHPRQSTTAPGPNAQPWPYYFVDKGQVHLFNIDRCETCKEAIQQANSVGGCIDDIPKYRNLGMVELPYLPEEGYYSDVLNQEACNNCNK